MLTHESVMCYTYIIMIGNCITALVTGERVYCPLNSMSFECDAEEVRAVSCLCEDGVESLLCIGKQYNLMLVL